MYQGKIGALVIGQSPRPDLVDPLRVAYPTAEIVEAGALDLLTEEVLPSVAEAAYPLITRMRSGRIVTVAQSFLEPHLQQALDRLEAAGVDASILLCAGTFADLKGQKPLIKPFECALERFAALGLTRLGLIAPVPEQEKPIQERWRAAGFEPTVWTADLTRQNGRFQEILLAMIHANQLEAIVLDYVGHPAEAVEALTQISPVPVWDLGRLAVEELGSFLAREIT
ncbi:MAG: AroM family protein [Ardenticatenaceae bacterium]|nr:AroM family protein [Ardenticatenaceae bacterium]